MGAVKSTMLMSLSTSRQDVALDSANHARGVVLLQRFYGSELDGIFRGWGAHAADFEWLAKNIIYGMFFSDEGVLDTIET